MNETISDKREKIAFALFADIYSGACDEDPTFPKRNWGEMDTESRALWYHKADVAITAGA